MLAHCHAIVPLARRPARRGAGGGARPLLPEASGAHRIAGVVAEPSAVFVGCVTVPRALATTAGGTEAAP